MQVRSAVCDFLDSDGGSKPNLGCTGEDQTVKLWDLGSSKLIKTMRGHRATIHSLSFSAESTVLVSGGADETVRVWDVSASSFPSSSTTSASAVAAAAAVARGAAAGSKASGESSNVLKKLSEGNLMDGKAGSTVGLLPQSSYTQDGIKDTYAPSLMSVRLAPVLIRSCRQQRSACDPAHQKDPDL